MPSDSTITRDMLRPRYWATWFYIGFIYSIACLPWRVQFALGRLVGRILRADKRLYRIAKTNIRRGLPELSEQQRDALLKRYFANQGVDLVESLNIWSRNGFKLASRHLEVEGLEHLREALAQNRGIILVGSHFSNVDMGIVLLAWLGKRENLFDFSITYREQKDPVFDWVMKRGRNQYFKKVVPATEIRPIVRELKENNIVWFAPDMDIDRKNAIFVPFLGIQASTTTSIHRLARMTGALVIPYSNYRDDNRFEYRLRIFPALEHFPSADMAADTRRINEWVENLVYDKPESYLWILRRFKTRPPGEAPFYD